MIKIDKNRVKFKKTEVDLLEFAFGILRDDFSNMIEIFRLEGRKQPMIRKTMINEYADNHFRTMHYQWHNFFNNNLKAPNLADLNIETLVDVAGNMRLMKCNHKNNDFSECNIYEFIEKGLFIPTGKRVMDMIGTRRSVVGILYHACLNASMISGEALHVLHFSHDKNSENKMWLTMFLPFFHDDPNYPDHILMLQKET